MPKLSAAALHRPATVGEAAALLDEHDGAQPLAGGTWLMRGPVRGEESAAAYVALKGIAELGLLEVGPDSLHIGAAVTHSQLAAALPQDADVAGLRSAAMNSANPAVRNMATVGGNLCTSDFPAADLVPALLALDAQVFLARTDARTAMSLAEYLNRRDHGGTPGILTHVQVPRRSTIAAHARLPLRAAGDYPVAIVNLSTSLDENGAARELRIVVGSVTTVAHRWSDCEEALTGRALTAKSAEEAARSHAPDLPSRDGIDAPAWYRREVVPVLLRRAVESIRKHT
jgi:carbon-monoxide dehydrogenase medium subunit